MNFMSDGYNAGFKDGKAVGEKMNQSYVGLNTVEQKTTYREAVVELWNKKLNSQQTLNAAAMGLSGESGEVVDLLKKHIFHEHPLDKDKLVKELGDVLYYAEILMNELGVTRSEVEKKNLEKLYNRYPAGFSAEASKNRKE